MVLDIENTAGKSLVILKRTLLLSVLLVVVTCSAAFANRDINFSWTANSESPPVDGYKLYYKSGDPTSGSDLATIQQNYVGTDASGGNASPVIISGQSSSSYQLANLLNSQKYSFVLTAYRGTEESDPTTPITIDAITTYSPPQLIMIDEVKE